MTPRLADTPVLVTERLTLRPPKVVDWSAYADFMQTDAASFFAGHGNPTAAWRSFGSVIWNWRHPAAKIAA